MGVGCFATCGAVEDALAGEVVETLDCHVPPGDSAGENDRRRSQDVAAVEVHLMSRGIDSLDRSGDEDLGAKSAGLLERPAGQPVARDARGESEIVLDPGGRARLAAGRLALDHDRPESLDAPYTAAARPAGPAPTMTVSYSAAAGSVGMSRSSATRRGCGRITVLPPMTRIAGRSPSAGRGPPQRSAAPEASGASQVCVTWLRSRNRRRCVHDASQRWPTTIARGGGGSAAMPWSPRSPLIRCVASRPTSLAMSGATAARSW